MRTEEILGARPVTSAVPPGASEAEVGPVQTPPQWQVLLLDPFQAGGGGYPRKTPAKQVLPPGKGRTQVPGGAAQQLPFPSSMALSEQDSEGLSELRVLEDREAGPLDEQVGGRPPPPKPTWGAGIQKERTPFFYF